MRLEAEPVRLVLAGGGSLWGGSIHADGDVGGYDQAVRQALADGISDGRVRILGLMSADQMPVVYAAADVLVVPSVWNEAFGMVALEAAASGRPVIASGTGGLAEIVTPEYGIQVPPGDEDALLDAVRALVADEPRRRRMGAAGREHARAFRWDGAAEQVERVYQATAWRDPSERERSTACSRHLRLWIVAAMLLVTGQVVTPPPVARGQAQPPTPGSEGPVVSRTLQADQNADGFVDLTTLETSFAGGADRVLVFDGGSDMQVSEDWRVATDFENDTWVFDAGGDGRAELIIHFARLDASAVEARIFDDVDGDGAVAFHVGAGTGFAVITESGAPMLTVTSWPSWVRPDGGLNYNIRIAQDGTFGGQEGAPEFLAAMRRDGRLDHEWILADEDGDGIPEYRIGRMLLPTPETSGLHRMGIQVNSGRVRPRENAAALFWPLLERSPTDRTGNYFDTAPTVDVDWSTARLRDAGIVGYPIEQGFHVNALNYLRPGIRNVPNFENAMAFYDLDGDHDHRAELFVRHRYYEAGDRHGENVVPASNEIRYSWTERNPNGLVWDYKLRPCPVAMSSPTRSTSAATTSRWCHTSGCRPGSRSVPGISPRSSRARDQATTAPRASTNGRRSKRSPRTSCRSMG